MTTGVSSNVPRHKVAERKTPVPWRALGPGRTPLALDLLIAAIALHHSAEVATFDDDYQKIATVSNLHVKLLQRPTP
jgi:predicted nucleic acid-binding protein